ncbi:MAG: YfhO family protein, partial [Saprospiraceae bacterium]
LKDKDPDFRVFDLTASPDPFRSSFASYFHKTIGGYHPAKLQRYQDLIDRYISQNHQPVLNMLNTKYYIVGDDQNRPTVQPNTRALGNAWFVDNYMIVESADQEFNGLNGLDPGSRAIIHKDFASDLEGFQPTKGGSIALTSYAPNKLVYASDAPTEQLAVFSEIWYGPDKGWKVFVDGTEAKLFRADYVLRAMRVPAGQHTIEMRFEPASVKIGKMISLIASGVLLLLLIGWIANGLGIRPGLKAGK